MKKSYFIVFDGLDGSGKSDMITKSFEHLTSKSRDIKVQVTREPSDGKYGKKIRSLLKTEENPMENAETFLDLYIKDRKDHVDKEIKPFLNHKKDEVHILLCDRYYYSTIAFQHTQGLPIKKLISVNKPFPRPDLVFILDLEPEVALDRIDKSRSAKEKFEQLGFMEALRKNFLALPKVLSNENIKIIDAMSSKKQVAANITIELDKMLNK